MDSLKWTYKIKLYYLLSQRFLFHTIFFFDDNFSFNIGVRFSFGFSFGCGVCEDLPDGGERRRPVGRELRHPAGGGHRPADRVLRLDLSLQSQNPVFRAKKSFLKAGIDIT